MHTSIRVVDATKIGRLDAKRHSNDFLDELEFDIDLSTQDAQYIREAAGHLRTSDVPVAFPTETVYGLGADATRSDAVKGIYKAKQRPSDNPLIVHFASLQQIRQLLLSSHQLSSSQSSLKDGERSDPIPSIYEPLIRKFWPGPLTIILPNPSDSSLAPEVTAGLETFGARIPRHVIALALIQLSGVPIAAPSANASTKPSPTAAEHVAYDLDGRIETIIDGGPCEVGVESTVVDGLSNPPSILRPGGVTTEQLKACPGWEKVTIGYKDQSEKNNQPKAPGMKYRHYSPKAPVILFEKGQRLPTMSDFYQLARTTGKIGLVTTSSWQLKPNEAVNVIERKSPASKVHEHQNTSIEHPTEQGFAGLLQHLQSQHSQQVVRQHTVSHNGSNLTILDLELGADPRDVARGIFAALRTLDNEHVDAILVEGIDDVQGDIAAAVMNRLRKAAEVKVTVHDNLEPNGIDSR